MTKWTSYKNILKKERTLFSLSYETLNTLAQHAPSIAKLHEMGINYRIKRIEHALYAYKEHHLTVLITGTFSLKTCIPFYPFNTHLPFSLRISMQPHYRVAKNQLILRHPHLLDGYLSKIRIPSFIHKPLIQKYILKNLSEITITTFKKSTILALAKHIPLCIETTENGLSFILNKKSNAESKPLSP